MSQKKSAVSAMSNNSAQTEVENVTSRFSAINFIFFSKWVLIIVAVLVGFGSAIGKYIVEEGEGFVRRFSNDDKTVTLPMDQNIQTLNGPPTEGTEQIWAGIKLGTMTEFTCLHVSINTILSSRYYLSKDNNWLVKWYGIIKLLASEEQIILREKFIMRQGYYFLSKSYSSMSGNSGKRYMVWELADKNYWLVCNFPDYDQARDTIYNQLKVSTAVTADSEDNNRI